MGDDASKKQTATKGHLNANGDKNKNANADDDDDDDESAATDEDDAKVFDVDVSGVRPITTLSEFAAFVDERGSFVLCGVTVYSSH